MTEGAPTARVGLGDESAQQLGAGEGVEVRGRDIPLETTAERTELEVRAFGAHDAADAVEGGVEDGRADVRGAAFVCVLVRHGASPLMITAASACATGAEQTPR